MRTGNPNWVKGRSANPKGRPPGTSRNQKLMEFLDREDENGSSYLTGIIAAMVKEALKGDAQAANVLLSRAIPALKPHSEPIAGDFNSMGSPPLEFPSNASLSDKANVILAAIANGSVRPDVGCQLLAGLGNVVKIMEVDSILRRIEALEGGSGGPVSKSTLLPAPEPNPVIESQPKKPEWLLESKAPEPEPKPENNKPPWLEPEQDSEPEEPESDKWKAPWE